MPKQSVWRKKRRQKQPCVGPLLLLEVRLLDGVEHDLLEILRQRVPRLLVRHQPFLRGAGEAGLQCRDIGERMLNRAPDITRLLDRLATRGLITRAVSSQDRRALTVKISPDGLRQLKELDGKLRRLHKRAMQGVEGDRLHILIDILEDIRAGIVKD